MRQAGGKRRLLSLIFTVALLQLRNCYSLRRHNWNGVSLYITSSRGKTSHSLSQNVIAFFFRAKEWVAIYLFLSRSLIDTTSAEGERVAMATPCTISGWGARPAFRNELGSCRPRSHTIERQSPADDEQEALHLLYLLHNFHLFLFFLRLLGGAKTRQEKSRHKVFQSFVFSSSIKSLFFLLFSRFREMNRNL